MNNFEKALELLDDYEKLAIKDIIAVKAARNRGKRKEVEYLMMKRGRMDCELRIGIHNLNVNYDEVISERKRRKHIDKLRSKFLSC